MAEWKYDDADLRAAERPAPGHRASGGAFWGYGFGGVGMLVLMLARCARLGARGHELFSEPAHAHQTETLLEERQRMREELALRSAAPAEARQQGAAQRMSAEQWQAYTNRTKWFRLRGAEGAWEVVDLNDDACPGPGHEASCRIEALVSSSERAALLAAGSRFASAARVGNALVNGDIVLYGAARRLHVRQAYLNGLPSSDPSTKAFFEARPCQLLVLMPTPSESRFAYAALPVTQPKGIKRLSLAALPAPQQAFVEQLTRSGPEHSFHGAIACTAGADQHPEVFGVFEDVFVSLPIAAQP